MKKKLCTLAALSVLAFPAAVPADDMLWTGYYVYNSSGTLALQSDGWLYQLVSVGGNGVIDPYAAPVDDVVLLSATAWSSDGWFATSLTGISISDHVFTRIFNDPIEGNATEFLVTDGWQYTVENVANPSPYAPATSNTLVTGFLPITYDAGANTSADGLDGANGYGWEPVPEPSAIALGGLGLLVVGVRRRFKRSAAR